MPLGVGITLMPRSLMEDFAASCWVNWLNNQSSLLVRIKSSIYMVTCICGNWFMLINTNAYAKRQDERAITL